MDLKLLTAATLGAAMTFTAAPAAAQHAARVGIPTAKSPDMIGPSPGVQTGFCGDDVRFGHRDDRRDHGRSNCIAEGWAYADGQWALYNNRSWEPDSYNDWWHDRPDRAVPRWVQEQRARGTCEPDRMWWSGSGWHC